MITRKKLLNINRKIARTGAMLFTLHHNNRNFNWFKVRVLYILLISAWAPTISTALGSWWLYWGRLFYIVHIYFHSILSGFNNFSNNFITAMIIAYLNFSKYTNRLRRERTYLILILRWTVPQTAHFKDEAWRWLHKKNVKHLCLGAMPYFFLPVINIKSLFHFLTHCLLFFMCSFSFIFKSSILEMIAVTWGPCWSENVDFLPQALSWHDRERVQVNKRQVFGPSGLNIAATW